MIQIFAHSRNFLFSSKLIIIKLRVHTIMSFLCAFNIRDIPTSFGSHKNTKSKCKWKITKFYISLIFLWNRFKGLWKHKITFDYQRCNSSGTQNHIWGGRRYRERMLIYIKILHFYSFKILIFVKIINIIFFIK